MAEPKFKDKKPFSPYHDEKKVDGFTVRLNAEERATLDKCKLVMEQVKDSTALKQLAWIGANVLHEPKVKYILSTLFKNKQKNERIGVVDFIE